MSDDGFSHLGRDESVKREQAERLQADVADLVLYLVEASLPITLASVLYDTIMAWASEALEHAGKPQERRAAGEVVPVFEFKRLVDLACQDNQLRADLDNAMLSVEEASWQLAATNPKSPAWYLIRLVLDQAIGRLLEASTRLLQLDADIRAASIREYRQEPVRPPMAVVDDMVAAALFG